MGLKQGGLFTVGRHTITAPAYGEPIYLVPFGDVHWGAPGFAKDRWLEFINERKGCPNTYYFGMGDYTDLASTSERKQLRDLHDSSIDLIERMGRGLLDEFAETIEHARGRILGFIQGNHDVHFMNGTTGTQYLCSKFKCEYFGCSTVRELVLKLPKNGGQINKIIHAHHGKGGGARLKGGSLNTVQYMAENVTADIYMMGHDHQKAVVPDTRIEYNYSNKNRKPGVRERQVFYVRTGSFLKGYEPGKVSYVADAAMKSSDLGGVTFEFSLSRKRVDGQSTIACRTRVIQ